MHDKFKFLSWVADPLMEVSNVSMLPVTWTENTFVYSWGPYPTVIPPNVFTIRRRTIEDVPVNPDTLALRAERELHPWILQDIHGGSDASSYDDVWLKESDSDW